jgi:two-component system CheB/CheR fusion protein
MDEEQRTKDPVPNTEAILMEENPDEEEESYATVPVVGIGASAGGLEVFKRLLGGLPNDTGFAYVVVQHLAPNHPSVLSEILTRATTMPVSEATDGVPVEANHVYVIPANLDLTMTKGALKLDARTQPAGTHMPIDRFLRSVADECGSRTIGIILSGTGSDGSAGVEAIKAAGGVTFAQEASTAKFVDMPQAAQATDCVDFELSPEDIAVELTRIGRHPYIAEPLGPQLNGPPFVFDEKQRDAQRQDDHRESKEFSSILAILHGETGIDFSLYREKMVKRRILRRLALRNIKSLAEYCERLKSDPNELKSLQRDLLISVTSFFRDPESFDALKTLVFPQLLKDRPSHDVIRVWVAGCATGEEAFTAAISLREYLEEAHADSPVQIFASDISRESIEKARTGQYLENVAEDLTPERLARNFTKTDGGYLINKDLREMCVFARHNLIDDPPFSRLDLICCRNVLIYLGGVRKNIIPRFHYALKPGGFLMLGASEAEASTELFSVADREHRIFAKQASANSRALFPWTASRSGNGHPRSAVPGKFFTLPDPELWNMNTRKEVDRILLSKYTPAGVVVNENMEVTEIRGKTGAYLALPTGKTSFSLVKMIPEAGLFLEVEKLIEQARKNGEPARKERVPYKHASGTGDLNLEVVPLNSSEHGSAMVLFEPVSEAAAPSAESAGDVTVDVRDRQISRLKQQLEDAKDRFFSVIEAQQTLREDNQNTTEEALSVNEELQSLNEELETAKEELQSTNQELLTVNDELQAKNTMLAQARDFAMSIVETVRQPLLVLECNLRIKMANRAFYRTFQVAPLDAEGQFLYSLSEGNWDLPGLKASLEGLLQEGNSFPDFEVAHDFPTVGRRTLVVGGCRIKHLDMLLVAVDDITDRKLAQQALSKSEDLLRHSQKMEAVGRLAGGVAHDFNNLLTVILGFSGLLQEKLGESEGEIVLDGAMKRHAVGQVKEIRIAAERAAALTNQLLAFSRRQVLQPKVFDLNVILAEFDKMLRRMVGERIKVTVDCAPDLWHVKADPGEIGRAFMNLWLNARDAMPGGGTLAITTGNQRLEGRGASDLGLAPGRYVMMDVHDTGVGMNAELQAHIFEPFFTTKETGKGTGLGLATVLGIVEQSGGVIRCNSELGEGTSFRIFLPAVAQDLTQSVAPRKRLAEAPRGTEVVLLVEDEDAVRKFSRIVLEKCGYVVIEATNGREGLAQCESCQGPIDLLVTDVMMPELSGRGLAERAVQLRPALKVIFVSGHTQDIVLKEGIEKGTAFLQKPFSAVDLAQKVRETLDSGAMSVGRA